MHHAAAGPSVGHAAAAAGWPLSFAIAAIVEVEILEELWVCSIGGVIHSDSGCGWSCEEEEEEEDEKRKEEEEQEEEVEVEVERQEEKVSAHPMSSPIQSHSKSINGGGEGTRPTTRQHAQGITRSP